MCLSFFQAKLKLEMEIEQMKKRVQKQSDRKDEDMEEMKSNYTRKVTIFLSCLKDCCSIAGSI